MPFVDLKLAQSISNSQRTSIKEQLGQAITCLSGKSEAYLMVNIEDDMHLYLAGHELEQGAAVTVYHYGDADKDELKEFGTKILAVLKETADINEESVYIIFTGGIENWTLFGETYHTDIFQRK